ncbi:MAG: Gfo/Idh/MocA family oxidoreductase [Actinomycetota bacterium]|jgi:predicted dehydrogenase
MIRVGIIGCGRIVLSGHAGALAAMPDVEVVAVADPSPVQRHAVGDRFGVPGPRRYDSAAALIAAGGLDVVDVAVPHADHLDVVLGAVSAGISVLSEKPLGATVDEIDQMSFAADRAGVGVAVCHNRLFDPRFAGAVDAVREGRIGQVFAVRLESLTDGWWAGAGGYDPAWRTRAAVSRGGCLLDNGYHSIYLAEALAGSPIVEVYARTTIAAHAIDVDDTAFVLATHASGATTSLQVAWSVSGEGSHVHEAYGDAGTVAIGRAGAPLAIFETATGAWSTPPTPASDGWGFTGLFATTLPALAAGRAVPAGIAEGRHVVEVLDAAYRSSASGLPVTVGPSPVAEQAA